MVLLYMFTKRLHQLQSEMVAQHLVDMRKRSGASSISGKTPKTPSTDDIPSYANVASKSENIKMDVIQTGAPVHRVLTVEDAKKQIKDENCHSAKRILSLHQLIKQHTILIFIIVISSILWVTLVVFVSDKI